MTNKDLQERLKAQAARDLAEQKKQQQLEAARQADLAEYNRHLNASVEALWNRLQERVNSTSAQLPESHRLTFYTWIGESSGRIVTYKNRSLWLRLVATPKKDLVGLEICMANYWVSQNAGQLVFSRLNPQYVLCLWAEWPSYKVFNWLYYYYDVQFPKYCPWCKSSPPLQSHYVSGGADLADWCLDVLTKDGNFPLSASPAPSFYPRIGSEMCNACHRARPTYL